MPGKPEKDMTLRILACRQVYSGKNKRGDTYTIYEIDAANAQGQTIPHKLRAFQALPTGQDIEVTVVPFNSETHGKSYTLHPKNSTGRGSTTDQLNELREELARQADMIAKLVARVASIETGIARGVREQGPPPSSAQTSDAGAQFGDEAPW